MLRDVLFEATNNTTSTSGPPPHPSTTLNTWIVLDGTPWGETSFVQFDINTTSTEVALYFIEPGLGGSSTTDFTFSSTGSGDIGCSTGSYTTPPPSYTILDWDGLCYIKGNAVKYGEPDKPFYYGDGCFNVDNCALTGTQLDDIMLGTIFWSSLGTLGPAVLAAVLGAVIGGAVGGIYGAIAGACIGATITAVLMLGVGITFYDQDGDVWTEVNQGFISAATSPPLWVYLSGLIYPPALAIYLNQKLTYLRAGGTVVQNTISLSGP